MQPLAADEVHLWWMSLAEPIWPEDELVALLDSEERERAARFRFDVHRRRFVRAHGLLRQLLGAYVGAAPESLQFAAEKLGKPRLTGAARDLALSFNFSHAEDVALLGVGGGAALGVDIEVERDVPELDAISRSHFTRSEVCALQELRPERRHEGFFAAWTRKEAYVKALGGGLSVPLDSFEVSLHPDEPAELRTIDGSVGQARAWTLWAGRPATDSWAAMATQVTGARVKSFVLR